MCLSIEMDCVPNLASQKYSRAIESRLPPKVRLFQRRAGLHVFLLKLKGKKVKIEL